MGAVELAAAEITGECSHPTAAGETAGKAHGVLRRTPAEYESGEPAIMMGPDNSGLIAASIITAEPA